jgi:hypothetical protein
MHNQLKIVIMSFSHQMATSVDDILCFQTDCLDNVRASLAHNPVGLHSLERGQLYFTLHAFILKATSQDLSFFMSSSGGLMSKHSQLFFLCFLHD